MLFAVFNLQTFSSIFDSVQLEMMNKNAFPVFYTLDMPYLKIALLCSNGKLDAETGGILLQYGNSTANLDTATVSLNLKYTDLPTAFFSEWIKALGCLSLAISEYQAKCRNRTIDLVRCLSGYADTSLPFPVGASWRKSFRTQYLDSFILLQRLRYGFRNGNGKPSAIDPKIVDLFKSKGSVLTKLSIYSHEIVVKISNDFEENLLTVINGRFEGTEPYTLTSFDTVRARIRFDSILI